MYRCVLSYQVLQNRYIRKKALKEYLATNSQLDKKEMDTKERCAICLEENKNIYIKHSMCCVDSICVDCLYKVQDDFRENIACCDFVKICDEAQKELIKDWLYGCPLCRQVYQYGIDPLTTELCIKKAYDLKETKIDTKLIRRLKSLFCTSENSLLAIMDEILGEEKHGMSVSMKKILFYNFELLTLVFFVIDEVSRQITIQTIQTDDECRAVINNTLESQLVKPTGELSTVRIRALEIIREDKEKIPEIIINQDLVKMLISRGGKGISRSGKMVYRAILLNKDVDEASARRL